MNYKNENLINRNRNKFIKNNSVLISLMEVFNKKVNEGVDFRRTTSSCVLNTDGEKPLIIYFKSPKEYKPKYDKNQNVQNFMSDGGLNQKNKKFLNLLSEYPINYKFKSPIKYKKEKLNEIKKLKYNSLNFTQKKLPKNRTSMDIQNDNDDSKIIYTTERGKFIRKYLLSQPSKSQEAKKRTANKFDSVNSNENKKGKKESKSNHKYDKKYLMKRLIKSIKFIENYKNKNKKNNGSNVFERKKQILEKNGVDISHLNIFNGSSDEKIDKEEEEKNNNNNRRERKLLENSRINSDILSNDMRRTKHKPNVDQFEYINKILQAHTKLPYSNVKLNNFFKNKNLSPKDNINIASKKGRNIAVINNRNDKENEKQIKKQEDSKTSKETNDEYPFSHKRSYRSPDELQLFMRLKKNKEKKMSKINESIKQKRLQLRFQNLYKLNLESKNIVDNKSHIKKRKELNRFYIGNEVSKNNSTFIEKKDYYMALYQSQLLMTNSNIDITNIILETFPSQCNNTTGPQKKETFDRKKSEIYNSDLLNTFIKMIKLIYVKKAFICLYQNYYIIKYCINCYTFITYLNSIIRKYAFHKLIAYYKSGKDQPKNNKNEINQNAFQILAFLFKKNIFKKLLNYYKQNLVKDKLENSFRIIAKPHLKNTFHVFKNHNNNDNKNKIDNNDYIDIKINYDAFNDEKVDKESKSNNFEEIKNNDENKINTNNENKANIINKLNEQENKVNHDMNNNINNNNIIASNNINKEKEIISKNNNDKKEDDEEKSNEYNVDNNQKNEINNNNYNNKSNNIESDKSEEVDISADKDMIPDIDWGYLCSENSINQKEENNKSLNQNINQNNEPKKDIKIDIINNINKQRENEIDDSGVDLHNVKSYSEYSDIQSDSKTSKEKNNDNDNDIDNVNDNNISKNHSNINIALKKEPPKFNISKILNKNKKQNISFTDDLIIDYFKDEPKELQQLIKSNIIDDPNKFADNLTEDIIKHICDIEIKSPDTNLIPSKLFKSTNDNSTNENKDISASSDIYKDQPINEASRISLDSSLNISTFSVFNKTIKDKKKKNSINLYMDKIAPKLIRLIYRELIDKHKRIFENISTPYKNNSENIMICLVLGDYNKIKDNYKIKMFKEQIEDIIDKKSILSKFNKLNNELRIKDSISSDNYYDKIINECILDATIELVNKERLYYIEGEPLAWGQPRYEYLGDYDYRSNPKAFAKHICKSLFALLNKKLGLIKDKYDVFNVIDHDKINAINSKRLDNMIKEELTEIDKEWNNLEIQETQAKLMTADYIFEMMLRENIEILEHIQYSRIRPDLYNNKSIYATADMPKLSFQKTENNGYNDDFEDDLINI